MGTQSAYYQEHKQYFKDYQAAYHKSENGKISLRKWDRKDRMTKLAGLEVLKHYFGGCMDCGYNKHAEALEFDHRPGEKKRRGLARLMHCSWAVILTEIAKCDLVCANCHRVRTTIRRLL